MDQIIFSIIVPIYNAEKYLKRSVKSLVNQRMRQIEIILVDDGSTDKCGEICDAYAVQDNRIRVIHKTNGGVPTARNAGIRVAKGTYISFVDADDYIDSDAYEKIFAVLEEKNPDCVDFGWKYISDTGEVTSNLNGLEKNVLFNKDFIKNRILPPLLNLIDDPKAFIFDFSCNKIFKTRILRDNEVCFNENRRTWEDRIFVVKYLKYCDTFYSMDECFYNYVSVQNSLSRRYSPDYFKIIVENYQFYQSLYGDVYDFEIPYATNYWCHAIENMINRQLKIEEKREEVLQNIKYILENEQVIQWYKNRIAESKSEEIASKLVSEGRIKEAIELYKKKLIQESKMKRQILMKNKVKAKIKHILNI